MTTILETERLRLRQFNRFDLIALAEMVADEEQMTFYPKPKTKDEASDWIDRNLEFYENFGFGFWLIEPKRPEFLGYCGIRPLDLRGNLGNRARVAHSISLRVGEKLGMQEERTNVIDDYPAGIYAITASASR